jgi:putative transposase
MPWEESDKVTERMRFVTRHLDGERISDLSREFGISRQTGHALVKRYKLFGPAALKDRSSRPHRSPNRTPAAKAEEILKLRKKHPTWGPKKLKERLERLQPDVRWPACSTIGAILADAGVVRRRKRRRRAFPSRTRRRETTAPNELWCMDYKGHFRLGNGQYCYPLTVTDHYSRFLAGCEALENTRTGCAEMTLWALFAELGVPDAVRSDNGAPFASCGRLGLSRLSVRLMRLGIEVERIEPGHPEQNGRHERMHLTLKQDATRPPAANILAQQEKFDLFRATFNEERPHEALSMRTPADVYLPSTKRLPERMPSLSYPLHDHTCRVYPSGSFRLPAVGLVYLGLAFADQDIGLREIGTKTWLVTFMDLDIGYLDANTKQIIDIPKDSNTQ